MLNKHITLLEQIAKISEANEDLLNQWAEKYKIAQQLIDNQREEIINLKNQNFRLKERLKVSSDKYHALTKKKTFSGEFPSSATDA